MEIGEYFAVIAEELENGDPFYVVLFDIPLYTCNSTFEDEWENTWFRRDMKLIGIYYQREKGGCASGSIPYSLLRDRSIAIDNYHFVVHRKFPMMSGVISNNNHYFSMS